MLAAFSLWLTVVAGGTILMIRYSSTPGVSGLAPRAWPAGSQIPFDAQRPTLIMFAHPQCPCTRASLGELEVLLAQFPGRLNTCVAFVKPAGTAADWEKSDLWRRASAISGVRVITDNAGIEAHRFQSETSGQTLLYDRGGKLLFQGGITLGRGHAGDNPGRSALQDLLRQGHATLAETPVFGCSLVEAQCKEGDITCKSPIQ